MSDQAQGLRTLADQARRDQCGASLPSPPVAEDVTGDTFGNRAPIPAEALPAIPPVPGIAVTDARLHGSRAASLPARRKARVVAVTSGKGGVGKTNFSTNLSLTLAQTGQRVIVLDADLGLANLHVVMGISPRYHLEHVLRGEKTLREILYPGPCGIQIIAGGSGITELANLDEATRTVFVEGLKELDNMADLILIDTGAGLSHNVMAFLCAVDEIIVLTTPEPTAITDAYATIKVVSQENPGAHQMLVVNMAQSEAEARSVADKLLMIAHQFLRIDLDCLGYIPQDSAVSRAVRAQQPFALNQPNSAAARSVAQIAAQLGYRQVATTANSGVGGLLNRMQRFFGFRESPPAGTIR